MTYNLNVTYIWHTYIQKIYFNIFKRAAFFLFIINLTLNIQSKIN